MSRRPHEREQPRPPRRRNLLRGRRGARANAAPKRCGALRAFSQPIRPRSGRRRCAPAASRSGVAGADDRCRARAARCGRSGSTRRRERRDELAAVLAAPCRRVADLAADRLFALSGREAEPARADRRARRRCCPPPPPAPTRSIQRRSASRSRDQRIERLADLLVGGALGEQRTARPSARVRLGRGARSSPRRARAASSAAAAESSITANWPGTFASKGNSCSSRSQKAWIVWIFSPPGVSSALAKSRRACRISCGGGRAALQLVDRRRAAPPRRASSIRRACRRRGATSPPRRPW